MGYILNNTVKKMKYKAHIVVHNSTMRKKTTHTKGVVGIVCTAINGKSDK